MCSVCDDGVELVVIQGAELGNLLVRRLPLIKKHLDLGLKLSLLAKLADSTSGCSVFFAVKATSISAHGRNIVL